MARILSVTDWYLPAYKAGGPVRSISNLVSTLAGSDFEFFVLTRDRDLTETAPYPGVPLETWTQVGNARVFYTADHSLRNFRRRITEIKPDVIYLNSFFSTFARKVLLLRRLGLIGSSAVIVAPRGELSPGALRIKWRKKKTYLRLVAFSGLYRNLLWHATAPLERNEIAELLRSYHLEMGTRELIAESIHVASNIPGSSSTAGENRTIDKQAGEVRFLFVSRVSPKKNLAMAIELVALLRGNIRFDIYGPVDDPAYWQSCEELIARAPKNVQVRYLGPLTHDVAQRKFSEYHFFLFPTLSENFGHVIAESLAAGCPVVISDQTPWSGLAQKNIGWELPLNDRNPWLTVLQQCADMNAEEYQAMSCDCVKFFREWAHSPAIRNENVGLFQRALAKVVGS